MALEDFFMELGKSVVIIVGTSSFVVVLSFFFQKIGKMLHHEPPKTP